MKDDFIAAVKKGANLNVSVQNQMGREITFAVPAAGFGKAFDGPPIDPKVLEEQQKKLQEELQKKSEEMRQKMLNSGAGAAPPGVAAPGAFLALQLRPLPSRKAGLSDQQKRRARCPAFFVFDKGKEISAPGSAWRDRRRSSPA